MEILRVVFSVVLVVAIVVCVVIGALALAAHGRLSWFRRQQRRHTR